MRYSLKHPATIKNAKVTLDSPDFFALDCKRLEGKEVYLILKKKTKTRSTMQNAYFHAVILRHLAEATGHSDEEIKDVLKHKFLTYRTKLGLATKATSELNTAEMEEFHESCRRWASEFLGVFIPLPNQLEIEP